MREMGHYEFPVPPFDVYNRIRGHVKHFEPSRARRTLRKAGPQLAGDWISLGSQEPAIRADCWERATGPGLHSCPLPLRSHAHPSPWDSA